MSSTAASFEKLLICPETKQALRIASPEVLGRINSQIANGAIKKKSGETITEPLSEGLLRVDGKVLYPILNGIPLMLIEESIDILG